MFRRTVFILILSAILPAWAMAEPGTWGKETPAPEKEAKAPAAMLNRWLNEFTAAYEQRDGEKMGQLIKRFEEAKRELPAAPRMEKWMANVKQAYQDENIKKMGKLLDNAQQIRDRMREHFRQNRNRRRGENRGGFGPEGSQPRGFDRDFQARSPGEQRNINTRSYGPDRGYGYGRPENFRSNADMPRDGRQFEGRMPRFEGQRPTRPDFRSGDFAPRFAPRGRMERPEFGPGRMPRDKFYRPDLGPAPQEPREGRFAPRMRPEFDRRYDGPRNYPQDW